MRVEGWSGTFGVGEEEHLSGAAHELQGLLHGGVGGHGDDGGVEGRLRVES